MSVKLMWSAMTVKAGSPTAKLILLKLADNANDKGECWPSLKNIAEHCEVSQKTVITNIKKLEELGYVKKINRFNDKGKTSNLYVITLTESEPVEDNSSPEPCEKTSTTHVKKRKEPCEKTSTTPCEKSSHESVSYESVKEPVKTKSQSAEQAIVDLYNQILANKENQYSLPQVKVITENRKKVISKFWLLIEKDLTKVSTYFNWLITNANAHKWLFGANERNWVADIEYICRDETLAKATENRLSDWRDAA